MEISPPGDFEQGMLAGHGARLAGSAGQQGADAGKAAHHVAAAQPGPGEMAGRLAEQIVDLSGGDGDLLGRVAVVQIGGPDQRQFTPGDDKEHPVVPVGTEIERLAAAGQARHQQVRTAGRPQPRDPVARQGADPVEPGAAGVDHDLGRDLDGLSGFAILDHGAVDPDAAPQQGGDPGVVDRDRAGLPCRDDIFQAEPGIVHAAVPVEGRAGQPLGIEQRLTPPGLVRRQHPMWPGVAPQGEQVVEQHPGVHQGAGRVGAAVKRDQQWQRADQMRRDALQGVALAAGLEDQPEVEPFQVTQAAVDQFGRARRSAAGKIVLLDQGDHSPAQGQVAGDAGAGDAAADDQRIEAAGGETAKVPWLRGNGRHVHRVLC